MCWFWTRYDNVFASYTIPPPWNEVGSWDLSIMTSSNGIIFHVTGHLWGESTGDRGVFRSQRPVTRNFDALADLRLNKRFSKHSRCRWFETPSRSLWRRCNVHGKEGCTYFIVNTQASLRLQGINSHSSKYFSPNIPSSTPVAYLTKGVNPGLAQLPLKFNGGLAKLGLTSLVRQARYGW